MGFLNRASLRKLSRMRLQDARVLLRSRRYAGAYYLAGYAVECALKARVAQNTRRYDFPDKKLAIDCYTHDLERLMSLAGLAPKLNQEIQVRDDFRDFWLATKDWNEETRYNDTINQRMTQDLIEAITNPVDGILQWIEKN